MGISVDLEKNSVSLLTEVSLDCNFDVLLSSIFAVQVSSTFFPGSSHHIIRQLTSSNILVRSCGCTRTEHRKDDPVTEHDYLEHVHISEMSHHGFAMQCLLDSSSSDARLCNICM
jgi:hypothetical protein